MNNGLWCSGNTADFDSAISGSNPDSPANIFSCSLVLMRITKRKATIAVDYVGSSPTTRARPAVTSKHRVECSGMNLIVGR